MRFMRNSERTFSFENDARIMKECKPIEFCVFADNP